MKSTLTILKITLTNLLLVCAFSVNSQCVIDGVTAEITACEGDLFDVSINFEFDNTSDQFTIAGNGVSYGTFNYDDLPITLTSLAADCDTEYEFVVTDVNENDCTDFVILGTACCEEDCVINSIDYDDAYPDCVDGNMSFLWLIFAENTSEVGFDIFLEDDFLTFVQYDGIGPYEVDIPDTGTEFFTIKVCDNDDPDCCYTSEWPNACYEEPVCEIGEINYELTECDNDLFNIFLNFEYANTGDQFKVTGNGINYGTFSYGDLPILIEGLEGDCSTEYEFVVTDLQDNNCTNFVEVGTVCCGGGECDLFDLVIETSECDGGFFNVTFDFEYTGTTNDFFDWEIPGVDSGFASFADLPKTITVENTSIEVMELFINENDNPDCNIAGEFENPCYDPQGECFIGELNVEVSECDGNQFFVVIDFEYENTGDEFKVLGNGNNYGTFLYADLPITIDGLESNCNDAYEFAVFDLADNSCASDVSIGIVCCDGGECDLFDLVIETSECDGGFFNVTFDFEYTGTTNDFFDWEIPGVDSGFASFADLPKTITVENTSIEVMELFINENDNPDCNIAGEFENPCYDPQGECFIGELNVEVSECDGNQFFVVIDFEYENTGDEFKVLGNGNNYGTFLYADLPITIDGLESNCNDAYEFAVFDLADNSCASDVSIGIVCCDGGECDLFDLVIETSECDGGIFTVTFDFEYEGTTNDFFDWEIPGVDSGFASFADLPKTISIDNSSIEVFELFINENDNPDCSVSGEFENPCYDPQGECFIGELNVEVSECDGNQFFVVIDFEYENTGEDFKVLGNGNNYGTFLYADLPITIDGLESDCDTDYEFVVIDLENGDCASDVSIGIVCCDGGECDLFDLVIETSECDGGFFNVTFDFEYTGTTNDFFDWEIPGVDSGFASFTDLPKTITVENTSIEVMELFINENDNPDCNIAGEFENPCYDPQGECFIGELNVEVSECDGNQFFVVIDFEYENTGDEFKVLGNGNNYGTFLYADLPITIDGLESNCNDAYEFAVFDLADNSCVSDVSIGIVCCDGGECDLFDLVIETSECDGGIFTVTFDFEYEGTTNDFFDWEIPGVDSGFASFADLPKTISIDNSSIEVFELFINENDNPDCSVSGEFENPCYDPQGECFIGELNVEVSECDGNQFFVVIDFEYENTGEDFKVLGNGNNYGTFLYADLPITIDGLESDCDTDYEFVVIDIENGDCASDVGIGEVCCEDECDLFDLVVETSECDGGVFTVTFDFEYEGTTNDLFNWGIPGVADGTASFDDLPKTISIENSSISVLELLINENDNPDCSIAGEFENPCFDPQDECFIGEINIEVSECDGNQFFVVIDFEYENTGDEFKVLGNGNNYGTFLYADLPITIDGLESDCDLDYEFVVIDLENGDCASDVGIGEVCCEDECDLFDLNFDVSECDGGVFVVEIDFEYEGTTSVNFSWEIPGVGSGVEPFEDLPLVVEIENANESQFTFFANDNDNQECSIVGTFGNPCFDSDECSISDVSAEVIACENDLYDVEINFDYANVGSSFEIVGNGVNYGTFEYANLPITLSQLEADCTLEYEFVINDLENEDCSDFVEIGTICCDDFNQINGLNTEPIIDGESFKININIENTTLKDCKIEVYIDGELHIVLNSDESSFEIGPFECGQDNILVIDLVNTCTGEGEIFEIDLSDIECITNIDVDLLSVDLNWNMQQKILSIDGEEAISVNVQILNTQGSLIKSQRNVQNGWSTDLSELPSGLYFIRLEDNSLVNHRGFIHKIVIY